MEMPPQHTEFVSPDYLPYIEENLFVMRIVCVLGFCIISLVSSAQTYLPPVFTDEPRLELLQKAFPYLDSTLIPLIQSKNIPGMAFGIIANGKLIYTKYYGKSNIEKNIPVGKNTAFRIASMTKSATAMAILQLRDAGKINLDAPVANYIPEMKLLKPITTDAPPITVRDLLTHRAGFPEDNPYGDRQLGDSEKELSQQLSAQISLSNAPGIAYEYSNLGFAMLGRIISNITKQPYQRYISEHIFKPLGMAHTYWDYTKVAEADLAYGYRWMNNNWEKQPLENDGSWGAMGGLITTLEDYTLYVNAHLQAWPVRNGAELLPLKRSSIREMHQPWNFGSLNTQYQFPSGKKTTLFGAYGYGLRVERDGFNRLYVGHSGGLPGFGSNWRILPEYGIGIIIFANSTYAPVSSLTIPILDSVLMLSGIKPRQLPASAILQQRQKELMTFLPNWKKGLTSPIFAENFFDDNPLDLLQANTNNRFDKIGKIVAVSDVVPENQLRGSFYISGEKNRVKVYFTLTPEKNPLIQQLTIE
jgi:CubicO group peptidase (beta-lactamase class C family)